MAITDGRVETELSKSFNSLNLLCKESAFVYRIATSDSFSNFVFEIFLFPICPEGLVPEICIPPDLLGLL